MSRNIGIYKGLIEPDKNVEVVSLTDTDDDDDEISKFAEYYWNTENQTENFYVRSNYTSLDLSLPEIDIEIGDLEEFLQNDDVAAATAVEEISNGNDDIVQDIEEKRTRIMRTIDDELISINDNEEVHLVNIKEKEEDACTKEVEGIVPENFENNECICGLQSDQDVFAEDDEDDEENLEENIFEIKEENMEKSGKASRIISGLESDQDVMSGDDACTRNVSERTVLNISLPTECNSYLVEEMSSSDNYLPDLPEVEHRGQANDGIENKDDNLQKIRDNTNAETEDEETDDTVIKEKEDEVKHKGKRSVESDGSGSEIRTKKIKLTRRERSLKRKEYLAKLPEARRNMLEEIGALSTDSDSDDDKEAVDMEKINEELEASRKTHRAMEKDRFLPGREKTAEMYSRSKFLCEECGKCYINLRSYNSHIDRHRGRNWQCTKCTKVYGSYDSYLTHMRFHSTGKSYQCNVCSKVFERNVTLKNHLKNHLNEQFTCTVDDNCKKVFKQKGNLKEHEKYGHRKEKTIKCEICSKKFKTPTSMRAHRVQQHKND